MFFFLHAVLDIRRLDSILKKSPSERKTVSNICLSIKSFQQNSSEVKPKTYNNQDTLKKSRSNTRLNQTRPKFKARSRALNKENSRTNSDSENSNPTGTTETRNLLTSFQTRSPRNSQSDTNVKNNFSKDTNGTGIFKNLSESSSKFIENELKTSIEPVFGSVRSSRYKRNNLITNQPLPGVLPDESNSLPPITKSISGSSTLSNRYKNKINSSSSIVPEENYVIIPKMSESFTNVLMKTDENTLTESIPASKPLNSISSLLSSSRKHIYPKTELSKLITAKKDGPNSENFYESKNFYQGPNNPITPDSYDIVNFHEDEKTPLSNGFYSYKKINDGNLVSGNVKKNIQIFEQSSDLAPKPEQIALGKTMNSSSKESPSSNHTNMSINPQTTHVYQTEGKNESVESLICPEESRQEAFSDGTSSYNIAYKYDPHHLSQGRDNHSSIFKIDNIGLNNKKLASSDSLGDGDSVSDKFVQDESNNSSKVIDLPDKDLSEGENEDPIGYKITGPIPITPVDSPQVNVDHATRSHESEIETHSIKTIKTYEGSIKTIGSQSESYYNSTEEIKIDPFEENKTHLVIDSTTQNLPAENPEKYSPDLHSTNPISKKSLNINYRASQGSDNLLNYEASINTESVSSVATKLKEMSFAEPPDSKPLDLIPNSSLKSKADHITPTNKGLENFESADSNAISSFPIAKTNSKPISSSTYESFDQSQNNISKSDISNQSKDIEKPYMPVAYIKASRTQDGKYFVPGSNSTKKNDPSLDSSNNIRSQSAFVDNEKKNDQFYKKPNKSQTSLKSFIKVPESADTNDITNNTSSSIEPGNDNIRFEMNVPKLKVDTAGISNALSDEELKIPNSNETTRRALYEITDKDNLNLENQIDYNIRTSSIVSSGSVSSKSESNFEDFDFLNIPVSNSENSFVPIKKIGKMEINKIQSHRETPSVYFDTSDLLLTSMNKYHRDELAEINNIPRIEPNSLSGYSLEENSESEKIPKKTLIEMALEEEKLDPERYNRPIERSKGIKRNNNPENRITKAEALNTALDMVLKSADMDPSRPLTGIFDEDFANAKKKFVAHRISKLYPQMNENKPGFNRFNFNAAEFNLEELSKNSINPELIREKIKAKSKDSADIQELNFNNANPEFANNILPESDKKDIFDVDNQSGDEVEMMLRKMDEYNRQLAETSNSVLSLSKFEKKSNPVTKKKEINSTYKEASPINKSKKESINNTLDSLNSHSLDSYDPVDKDSVNSLIKKMEEYNRLVLESKETQKRNARLSRAILLQKDGAIESFVPKSLGSSSFDRKRPSVITKNMQSSYMNSNLHPKGSSNTHDSKFGMSLEPQQILSKSSTGNSVNGYVNSNVIQGFSESYLDEEKLSKTSEIEEMINKMEAYNTALLRIQNRAEGQERSKKAEVMQLIKKMEYHNQQLFREQKNLEHSSNRTSEQEVVLKKVADRIAATISTAASAKLWSLGFSLTNPSGKSIEPGKNNYPEKINSPAKNEFATPSQPSKGILKVKKSYTDLLKTPKFNSSTINTQNNLQNYNSTNNTEKERNLIQSVFQTNTKIEEQNNNGESNLSKHHQLISSLARSKTLIRSGTEPSKFKSFRKRNSTVISPSEAFFDPDTLKKEPKMVHSEAQNTVSPNIVSESDNIKVIETEPQYAKNDSDKAQETQETLEASQDLKITKNALQSKNNDEFKNFNNSNQEKSLSEFFKEESRVGQPSNLHNNESTRAADPFSFIPIKNSPPQSASAHFPKNIIIPEFEKTDTDYKTKLNSQRISSERFSPIKAHDLRSSEDHKLYKNTTNSSALSSIPESVTHVKRGGNSPKGDFKNTISGPITILNDDNFSQRKIMSRTYSPLSNSSPSTFREMISSPLPDLNETSNLKTSASAQRSRTITKKANDPDDAAPKKGKGLWNSSALRNTISKIHFGKSRKNK
ncbi:hypothetical protein AYI70_g7359 [Smittium culicis]|uniref:Uncharacterized protein n=1 Tax=Smittium culicis TaxID=133412 RepID=A0A1R1XL05_9FUNG|nr:hypothetical protein AYI70_g7359 [Smittium culicis]